VPSACISFSFIRQCVLLRLIQPCLVTARLTICQSHPPFVAWFVAPLVILFSPLPSGPLMLRLLPTACRCCHCQGYCCLGGLVHPQELNVRRGGHQMIPHCLQAVELFSCVDLASWLPCIERPSKTIDLSLVVTTSYVWQNHAHELLSIKKQGWHRLQVRHSWFKGFHCQVLYTPQRRSCCPAAEDTPHRIPNSCHHSCKDSQDAGCCGMRPLQRLAVAQAGVLHPTKRQQASLAGHPHAGSRLVYQGSLGGGGLSTPC
jgi:hypothetical protein